MGYVISYRDDFGVVKIPCDNLKQAKDNKKELEKMRYQDIKITKKK